MQTLLNIKPSPVLSSILATVNTWQLDNPQGSREECEVWLKAKWDGGEWEEEIAAFNAKRDKRKR